MARKFQSAIFPTLFVGLVCQALTVQAASIPTNWWSNRTSSSNVSEFGAESLRLSGGATSGFVEGSVALPHNSPWTIYFRGRTDESVNLPTEYVDAIVDTTLVDRTYNSPPSSRFAFNYTIVGDQFDYRFDFSSPSSSFADHMVVEPGTVIFTTLPGDGNCDGWVNGLDYIIWANAFGTHPGPDGDISDGDYNDDGWVDGGDYLLWAENFGSHLATSAPEPGAFVVLAIGMMMSLARRRRA